MKPLEHAPSPTIRIALVGEAADMVGPRAARPCLTGVSSCSASRCPYKAQPRTANASASRKPDPDSALESHPPRVVCFRVRRLKNYLGWRQGDFEEQAAPPGCASFFFDQAAVQLKIGTLNRVLRELGIEPAAILQRR